MDTFVNSDCLLVGCDETIAGMSCAREYRGVTILCYSLRQVDEKVMFRIDVNSKLVNLFAIHFGAFAIHFGVFAIHFEAFAIHFLECVQYILERLQYIWSFRNTHWILLTVHAGLLAIRSGRSAIHSLDGSRYVVVGCTGP